MDLNQLVGKNQSIKIVPSDEDSLRAIGLNVDLDSHTQVWYDQLRVTWKTWKKSAAIENHIEMFFQSRPDPHRLALVFVIKGADSKDCKPKTLPYYIVETLLKWSQKNGVYPHNSLKMPAFHIAIEQRNHHFLNLVIKTYQVSTIRESIIPIVKNMIKNDNCKQASQIVIAMELFNDISVEELLFPMVLQDKPNMVDEYLYECPQQIKPFLLFLDKFLDRNFNIRQYVQKYIEENKIYNIKYDKLHYKPLGKLVARLCNKFKVPIETCPNLSKNRTTGGLRYLIHQKYQERNVSSSVWDDLVKDALRQNATSGKDFIDMLVDYDKNEAMKWAMYLNLSKADLPLALREMTTPEESTGQSESWDEDNAAPVEYYKLTIPVNHIIMIDTAEKFYDLMNTDLVKSSIVSIDCEWKPSFIKAQSQVALIQIATSRNVYLIDTLLLNQPCYASFWYTFYKSLLDNAEIIKLGFGIEQDLKEMKASIVGLGNIRVKGEGLLDLALLWKSLINSGLSLPGNSSNGGNSLTCLVQSCFGLPLEKSEQCSNWELRPLRSTQIWYAALDAYVLIEIYEFLQKLCMQQGINFEEICNDVMLENKKKCTKKGKVLDKAQSTSKSESKSPKDIKLLIEPNLSELMTYLRHCGIDTMVIPNCMLWYDIINLAISEDRCIVLSKMKCTPTANYPQSSIIDVGKGSVKDHVLKILKHFAVKVKHEDLFNRCMCCNNEQLKKLSPNEVNDICNDYECPATKQDYERYNENYEDDNYSNFLSESDSDEDLYQPEARVFKKKCTSKGIPLEIDNAQKLAASRKSAVLCELCGRLYWDEDKLYKSVNDIVLGFIKLSV